ncbi:MAG: glycosyltransferase [Candidatus Pacebacteria bacterium]|nr:glycosyltransferase [Candidatus Paceibacterota bacterium]
MLSIIIPTFNEEKFLPFLLESIKREISGIDIDYEIIVADAGSKDRTREIAAQNNVKIIQGGLPAQGKNNGAKAAQGSLLLFLDADTILPDNFFKKAIDEFNARELKIAGFPLLPDKGRITALFFNIFYNFPVIFMERFLAHASAGILIDKGLFDKINGFDEDIKLAEDHDLARRAKKMAKYGFIKSSVIYISKRRFKRDGWFKTYTKYVLCELYMVLIGPVKSDIFRYRFGHYYQKIKKY